MFQLPSGAKIEKGVKLAQFTSWTVGGEAEYFALPTSLVELREAIAFALLKKLPITILGGGTNVLVSDQGVPGMTLALRKLSGIESKVVENKSDSAGIARIGSVTEAGSHDGFDVPAQIATPKLYLECLAGTSKTELLKQFLKHRLKPALFLAGLPGDVGGGIAMNAGVGEKLEPREFVEVTEWVEVLRWDSKSSNETCKQVQQPTPVESTLAFCKPSETDNASITAAESEAIIQLAASFETVRIQATELVWSYRHCNGWQPGLITRAGLSWPLLPVDDLLDQVKKANHARLMKQPLDLPSCGSVFVNPVGYTSGQLVESCGLKGFSIGGAEVSVKHANFIVNRKGATASDIHAVIEHVKATVLAVKGISLKTEVVYMGIWR